MAKIKILFLCKDRSFPGYCSGKFGLYNSASFIVNALGTYFDMNLELCVDGNCIDKFVTKHRPEYVILEAIWVAPDKLRELIRLHPKVSWIVRIHSKFPFLANEGTALEWCNEYSKIPNVYLCGNNKEFVSDMYEAGYECLYLPNIYKEEPYKNTSDDIFLNDIFKCSCCINISCLGAIRPMKNTLIQAVAALSFSSQIEKYLRFHINSSRAEQGGNSVLKNLRALFNRNYDLGELVEHEWMGQDELNNLVSKMNIGMQASYTESYNLIAAQHIISRVPIVTSDEIYINTSWLHADPNSVVDIRAKLNRAYYFSSVLSRMSYNKLSKSNEVAIKQWVQEL